MTNDTQPKTTFSSITTLILRQHRKELGFTKSKFSELLDLSPSAWGKIENGETQLSINILQKFKEASKFNIWWVITIGEYYEDLLKQHGWKVNAVNVSDDLLTKANEYYRVYDVYGNKINDMMTSKNENFQPVLFTGPLNKKIAPVFATLLEIETTEKSYSVA